MATNDRQLELASEGLANTGSTKSAEAQIHLLIKYSLLLDDSQPDLVSSAPFAANFIGLVRRLACSEAASMAPPMIPGEFVRYIPNTKHLSNTNDLMY